MPKVYLPEDSVGMKNLVELLSLADEIDREEGEKAYSRYNMMLQTVCNHYPGFYFNNVVAAFCALSPNNDYVGNLKSLISLMKHLHDGAPLERITVSTYKHCRDRAAKYLTGADKFVTDKRGLKTLNFYWNILRPDDPSYVTIDGHMVAAYCGNRSMTMKDAQIGKLDYAKIASCTMKIAKTMDLLPCQVQAIIWFARKRLYKIKFDGHFDMFRDTTDKWKILIPMTELEPFPLAEDFVEQVQNPEPGKVILLDRQPGLI